jgi:AraC-like DNA-binding protein/mannose-6-phosphate isomerase-like protein (cupin superfamily)
VIAGDTRVRISQPIVQAVEQPRALSHNRGMRNLSSSIGRDVLSDILASVRFRSSLLCRSELRAPWGFAVHGRDFATFHVVLEGGGFLDVDGVDARIQLSRGDLVILPHGSAHAVRDAAATPVTRLEELLADGDMDVRGTLRSGGGGALSVLVCGGFYFEDRATNPLLSSLPRLIHLRGYRRGVASWVRVTLDFLRRESDAGRPGADAVITRLSDILFIEALRAYAASPDAQASGFAVALRDPRIGRSLALVHRRPHIDWDLARMAKEAGMSRTAFAVRFHELVGEPPLKYATRCRMDRAAGLLRSTEAPIAQVAARVGYDSEVGFGRAFKRVTGISPAAYRRRSGPRSLAAPQPARD